MERNWNCQRLADFFDDFWKILTFLFENSRKKSIGNLFTGEFLAFFTRELWRFENIEGSSHGYFETIFSWEFLKFLHAIFDFFTREFRIFKFFHMDSWNNFHLGTFKFFYMGIHDVFCKGHLNFHKLNFFCLGIFYLGGRRRWKTKSKSTKTIFETKICKFPR